MNNSASLKKTNTGGKIMKKILALISSTLIILSLSACDFALKNNENTNQALQNSSIKSDGLTSDSQPSSLAENNSSTTIGKLLTREEAIEIALDHAGFNEKDVINLTAELDKETSWSEWEIEFDKDNYEYSYNIDASTGKIIKNNKEID